MTNTVTNITTTEEIPLIMTVEEVRRILKVSRNTGYELIRTGDIKSVNVRRQIRVTKAALLDYMQYTA